MANPKRQVIDTATTNPAEFLAGGAPLPAAPQPAPASTGNPAPVPGTSVPVNTMPMATPAPEPPPAAPQAGTPTSPVLTVPDPFVLIDSWNSAESRSNLRAYEVPGGCIVRATQQFTNGVLLQNLCFVPSVRVKDGQLVERTDNNP